MPMDHLVSVGGGGLLRHVFGFGFEFFHKKNKRPCFVVSIHVGLMTHVPRHKKTAPNEHTIRCCQVSCPLQSCCRWRPVSNGPLPLPLLAPAASAIHRG